MDNDIRPRERQRSSAPTQAFRTPEAVAAAQTLEETPAIIEDPPTSAKPANSKTSRWSGWRQKLALRWPPGKKEYLVAAGVVLAAGAITAFLLTHHAAKPLAAAKPAKAAPKIVKLTTVPSTLSGLPVDASVNKRPVTAVMIENSVDARPQSGLEQASVVFEAVAEGGVTRFMALYQDTAPDNIGPVRSARPYYIQWALGFDAAYAHVGGSTDGLADIKSWGVKDLDEFANGGSYHRVSTREAPHNVYTAISTLNQLETSKGYGASTFTGFPRKKEAPVKQPTAATINLTLSGSVYNAVFNYSAAANSYPRSEDGAPQIDANTNQQIAPKVVVAMVVPESQGALDSSGAYYSNYAVIGSGPVDIFQDGTVTTGQWTKASNTAQISFTDAKGQVIKLNPGQTWLTAVFTPADISYTP